MMQGRLILDPPSPGTWNMARDQAILEAVDAGALPTLRFYQWEAPTLSLGYFQSLSDRQLHPASQSCPVVRRSTGGGAIVHDQELTYSLALPVQDRASRRVAELYEKAHTSLIRACGDWHIQLTRFADTRAARLPTDSSPAEPFLCFQRRTSDDLIAAGYKVVGSAQRRTSQAVLQHGSILLQTSPAAPELPGIRDLSGRLVEATELAEHWSKILGRVLGIDFHPAELPTSTAARGEQIQQARFSADSWTSRRP